MFEGLNAQVLGISIDHIPCLQAWAESLGGIRYPLLSDFWPHGAVSELYGVLRHGEGTSERAIFVLDRSGVIRYIDHHAIDDQPDNEEVLTVLRRLENEASLASAAQEAASAGVYFEPEEPEGEIPAEGIVLYCARWCKDCKKAKAWLDERGLAYAEVDIDQNQAARRRVRGWGNGFLITPALDIGGTVVLDYDPARMEDALRKWKDADKPVE